MLYAENGECDYSGVVLAYSALIIPTFDVVRVVLFRIRKREPIFGADRNHIHHRLMDTGITQHKALGIIIAMAISYIIGNVILYRVTENISIIIIADIVIYILFSLLISSRKKLIL